MADAPATTSMPSVAEPAAPDDLVPGGPAPDENPLDEFHEKMEAFKALRNSDEQAADQFLAALGGRGKVEEEMILQLAAWKPLYRVDQF